MGNVWHSEDAAITWTTKAAKQHGQHERNPAAFVSFVPFAHFAVQTPGAEWRGSPSAHQDSEGAGMAKV